MFHFYEVVGGWLFQILSLTKLTYVQLCNSRGKVAKLGHYKKLKVRLFGYKLIWTILNFTTYLFNRLTCQRKFD